METVGKIRVGVCRFEGKKKFPVFPTYEGYTNIVVMTKSYSKWSAIGPYELKDDNGRIMENVWQGSKIYQCVPPISQTLRGTNQISWQYPYEVHIDENNNITPEYWVWREKLMNNPYPVRYPVGFQHRSKCICAYAEDDLMTPLNYIEGRKKIYSPLYIELVKKHPQFEELKRRHLAGENLLIIEVDGPHQESLAYYQEKYGVTDNWIENHTIEINQENLNIMLNDTRHPYGHGYCLASVLLGIEL